jgi:hypothetical protein
LDSQHLVYVYLVLRFARRNFLFFIDTAASKCSFFSKILSFFTVPTPLPFPPSASTTNRPQDLIKPGKRWLQIWFIFLRQKIKNKRCRKSFLLQIPSQAICFWCVQCRKLGFIFSVIDLVSLSYLQIHVS